MDSPSTRPNASAPPDGSLLPHQARPGLSRRWQTWAIAGAVLLLAVFLFARRGGAPNPSASATRPVPVLAVMARTADLPVSLTGLGTVTSLNTAVVRSRVDGQLIRVAFAEGQFVKEGDLLAEIDPRPFQVQLMQAEGQQAKDQAAYKNATMDQERFRSLVQQGILPRQQLDAQTSTVNQFEGALKADQAQVESAKLNLVYSRITAPISGRVGLRLVDPGNMVRSNDPNGIAIINPIQPINVVFTVPADSIQQVLLRSRAGGRLTVEAWDRDLKQKLASGALSAIDNQVDPATGTVKLKGQFPNEDSSLFPNQFVNARLLVDVLKGVVTVPTAALQRSPQGAFVYVVKEGAVEMRPVEVQATEGDLTALRKGVRDGELVVTDGLEKLRPGSKVSLPSADAPGGKKERK